MLPSVEADKNVYSSHTFKAVTVSTCPENSFSLLEVRRSQSLISESYEDDKNLDGDIKHSLVIGFECSSYDLAQIKVSRSQILIIQSPDDKRVLGEGVSNVLTLPSCAFNQETPLMLPFVFQILIFPSDPQEIIKFWTDFMSKTHLE